jgi:Secretion system C-terminal sorting domain
LLKAQRDIGVVRVIARTLLVRAFFASVLLTLAFFPLTSHSGSFSVDNFVRLDQNYPNPFNGTTEVTYSIPQPGHVNLRVYNMLGQEVQTLVNEDEGVNEYRVRFDGSGLPSGQYTYTLIYTANGNIAKLSHKMYLVK